MMRTVGKPVGYTNLRVYLTRRHREARLLTVGHNFFQAKLGVTEDGDKCDKHGNLGLLMSLINGGSTVTACD